MPGRHAILSASAAYRWLLCTPSARFEEQIPEQETVYAAEGTLAHDLAALILSYRSGIFKGSHAHINKLLSDLRNKVISFYAACGATNDGAIQGFDTMYQHAEEWATLIMSYGGTILIEQEYDTSAYIPLGFGTSDGTNITPEVLYISDYKYGEGQRVSAVGNKQMMVYGTGALVKAVELGYKPTTVVLTIHQPRAGGVSTWEIPVAELLTWAEMEVRPKALLAIAGQGEFVAGEHCQFCKARTSCTAYFEKFKKLKGIHDKRAMTDEDRAYVLTYGKLINSWYNKIADEAVEMLKARKVLPGFKLVAGQGKRQFRNEDNVIEILLSNGFESEHIFKVELRSLTDLEKALGPRLFKEMFDGEIITVEGQPKVAPADSDKPAIGASAADDYDDDFEDLT